MTIWFTDAPSSARQFVAPDVRWNPVENIPAWLRLLANGAAVWQAVASPSLASTPEETMVMIDDAAESQFDVVLQAARAGIALPSRLVCLAMTGSGFRGQRQRPWSALRGNLHLTVHHVVQLDAAFVQPALTMLPAVAAAETIREVSGGRLHPKIKWVNDVLIGGAKVSGVLTATGVSGATIDRVTFGVGMNISESPAIEPSPFVPLAGCLADADRDLHAALPAIFHEITTRLFALLALVEQGNTKEIFVRYRDLAGFLGERVVVWPEGTTNWQSASPLCAGTVLALNPDLSLQISGQTQPLNSGRMALQENYERFR
jgi:biotin-(acetyl-CoA carboxylase) ligase